MAYKAGKNTLLKRKPTKTERIEADRLEREERVSKSGPVKHLKADPDSICPICGGPMKLKEPKPNQTWKPFWGCINFQITGCKGSRKVNV